MKVVLALLFAYFIFFPFGQLAQISLQMTEVNVYIIDLLVFSILLSWGIWRIRRKKTKYQLPPLTLPLILFSLISFLSFTLATPLLSNREVMVAGLYLLRWLVYVGFYFVIADIKNRYLKPRNLIDYLAITGVALAIFGFVQYFLYPNLKPLEFLHWDPHFYRLVSTFLDPGFTGLVLALTLIILANLLFEKEDKKWLILAMFVTYMALILTHSRSSYLAFLTGIGLVSWLRKNFKILIISLLVLFFSLLILPQPEGEGGKLARTYTIDYRIENYKNTLTIAKDNLFLGVGFNAFRYAQRDYGFLKEDSWQASHAGAGADSSLLFVLATTGILGLMSYLWFLTRAGALAFWQRKKTIGVISLASLGAIIIHSFFLNSLFYPWIMGWLMILLACL